MSDILTDGKGNGIPQYRTSTGEYLPLLGDKAPYAQVVDEGGNIVFTPDNPAIIKGEVTMSGNYVGYSTDTKPTARLSAGNTFLELDTKEIYIYDGMKWVLF